MSGVEKVKNRTTCFDCPSEKSRESGENDRHRGQDHKNQRPKDRRAQAENVDPSNDQRAAQKKQHCTEIENPTHQEGGKAGNGRIQLALPNEIDKAQFSSPRGKDQIAEIMPTDHLHEPAKPSAFLPQQTAKAERPAYLRHEIGHNPQGQPIRVDVMKDLQNPPYAGFPHQHCCQCKRKKSKE